MSRLRFFLTFIVFITPFFLFGEDIGSFSDYYSPDKSWGFWTWTFIVAGAVIAVGCALFSGGTSVAAYATTLGTALGFTGVTAAMVGTLIVGLGTDVAFQLTADEILAHFSKEQFQESSKEMTTLPFPQNPKNGRKKIFKFVKEEIKDKPITSPEVQEKIRVLCMRAEMNSDYLNASIFSFQLNEYENALKFAYKAKPFTENDAIPDFIISVSSLYKSVPDLTSSIKLFNSSICEDNDNPITLLCYAIYLDRFEYLLLRDVASVDDYENLTKTLSSLNQKDKFLDLIRLSFYVRGLNIVKVCSQQIQIITKDDSLNIPRTESVLWHKLFLKQSMINFLDKYSIYLRSVKIEDEKILKQLAIFNKELNNYRGYNDTFSLVYFSLSEHIILIVIILILAILGIRILFKRKSKKSI